MSPRRFEGDRLVLATHNRGKLEEIAALLEPFGIACVSAADLGLPEPAETEATFVGNARIKAVALAGRHEVRLDAARQQAVVVLRARERRGAFPARHARRVS